MIWSVFKWIESKLRLPIPRKENGSLYKIFPIFFSDFCFYLQNKYFNTNNSVLKFRAVCVNGSKIFHSIGLHVHWYSIQFA